MNLKIKKSIPVSFLLAGLFCVSSSFAQNIAVDPNTDYFTINDKFYADIVSKDLVPIEISGFFQRPSVGNQRKVFLLPKIKFNKNNLLYINANGKSSKDIEDFPADEIRKIRIPLGYNGNMPNSKETVHILNTILRKNLDIYEEGDLLLEPDKNNQFPNLNFFFPFPDSFKDEMKQQAKKYRDALAVQADLQKEWSTLSSSIVAINGLNIKILLDGEVIAEKRFNNTIISQGRLPDVFVDNLDAYKINRFKEGGFEIQVDYVFKDAKLSSINANIDMKRVISKVISESRTTTSTSSSSGWQFLGFGKKRDSMKQAIQESLNESISDQKYANTNVVMEDADDDLIRYFESVFFPSVSESEVINNHLRAAEKAKNNGNDLLMKAHLKYAEYARTQSPDLKVDTDKALAALEKNDYIGFIAHGMKIGSTSSSGVSNYSRVLNFNAEELSTKSMSLNKNVSVNRTVTNIISTEEKERRYWGGICGFINLPFTLPSAGGGSFQKEFSMVTCVNSTGAYGRKGIVPGTLIDTIGGRRLTTMDDLAKAADNGTASVRIAVPGSWGQVWSSSIINVEFGKGLYK